MKHDTASNPAETHLYNPSSRGVLFGQIPEAAHIVPSESLANNGGRGIGSTNPPATGMPILAVLAATATISQPAPPCSPDPCQESWCDAATEPPLWRQRALAASIAAALAVANPAPYFVPPRSIPPRPRTHLELAVGNGRARIVLLETGRTKQWIAWDRFRAESWEQAWREEREAYWTDQECDLDAAGQ